MLSNDNSCLFQLITCYLELFAIGGVFQLHMGADVKILMPADLLLETGLCTHGKFDIISATDERAR